MKAVPTAVFAGIVADVPMTLALAKLKESNSNATFLTHAGYSAAGALLYGNLDKSTQLKAPAVVKGAVFGVGVWALGYFRLLPGLMSRRTPHHSAIPERNIQMILAHLAWGVSLALASKEFGKESGKALQDRQQKAAA